jgi:hypothetical protein
LTSVEGRGSVFANTPDMKKALQISAAFDEPEFLQNLVEKLAYRRYDIGYGSLPMPKGWKALETSSTETYVSGNIGIDAENNEPIKMPFITAFLFTCIKGKSEPYQMIWSSSLS